MSLQRVLAIETSSATGSVALAVGDAVAERRIATPREQTASVLGHVEALLAEAGIAPGDLDALVFGRGPGSFTGLRVAAAVVQGLSLAAGTPIVPVSSLAALAWRGLGGAAGSGAGGAEADAGGEPGPLAVAAGRALCVVDARMGEVYSALYRRVDGGVALEGEERIGPPAAVVAPVSVAPPAAGLAPDADPAQLAPGPPAGAWLAVGDAFAVYADALARLAAGAVAVEATLTPRARDLLPLAADDIAAGRFAPLEAALPVYLRESDAWKRH